MLLLVMLLVGLTLGLTIATVIGLITSVSSGEWMAFWVPFTFVGGCTVVWGLLTSLCYLIAIGILAI
jgi:hypothetical protein